MPTTPLDRPWVALFATALALSQVTTQPQAIKTQFDPVKDQDEVVQILRNGCTHMKQAFDIESIHIDDLIATKLPKSYDRAVALLVDLRELAQRSASLAAFEARVRELRERHR